MDVLLEETKAATLEKKTFCDKANLPYDAFLPQVTGYPFYNTSEFTMKKLRYQVDAQRLKMDVIDYFNGFSEDVQEIIEKFKLRHWVEELTQKLQAGMTSGIPQSW